MIRAVFAVALLVPVATWSQQTRRVDGPPVITGHLAYTATCPAGEEPQAWIRSSVTARRLTLTNEGRVLIDLAPSASVPGGFWVCEKGTK